MGLFDKLTKKLEQLTAKNTNEKYNDYKYSISINQSPEISQVHTFKKRHILDEGITIPQLILLWWSDGRLVNSFSSFFQYDYHIEGSKEIKKLFELGYIREATPTESINKLKVPELKQILRDNSLPVSGNKPFLIERILENIQEDIFETYQKEKFYKVTESGKYLLEKYQNIIWGHENKIYGIIDAFTFEKHLTVDPSEYSITILETTFLNSVREKDYYKINNLLLEISNLKNGDIDALLQRFCFEISGVSGSGEYLYIDWENLNSQFLYLTEYIKIEINKHDISDFELVRKITKAWDICSKWLPVSLVTNSTQATDLLFYCLNGDKENFYDLIIKLYNNVPQKYKYD